MGLSNRVAGVLALAVASAWGLAGVGWAQQGPPTAEERAGYIAEMGGKYPTIPDEVAGYMADTRNEFTGDTRCEVYDWFAGRPEGVSQDTADRASAYTNICVLPMDGLAPEAAAKALGDKSFVVNIEAGVMTAFARADHGVYICCAPQVDLIRLADSDYWARRIRLKELDHAFTSAMMIDPQNLAASTPFDDRVIWRGPNAPAAYRDIPFTQLKGRTQEGIIDSVNLHEKRKVAVYLPPGWTKDRTWPVVFVGDMAHTTFYTTVEALIEDGLIEPVIMVGVAAGWDAKVDGDPAERRNHARLRNGEYVPGHTPGDLFDRHLAYMAEEVTAWAAREYNASTKREERVIVGNSGGGTMALFTGLRRPDVFGYSVSLSPSSAALTEADLAPGQRAVFHMSGGVYEPEFYYNVQRFEKAMRGAGFDLSVEYPVSGHFPDHWRYVLANALIGFFPKRP